MTKQSVIDIFLGVFSCSANDDDHVQNQKHINKEIETIGPYLTLKDGSVVYSEELKVKLILLVELRRTDRQQFEELARIVMRDSPPTMIQLEDLWKKLKKDYTLGDAVDVRPILDDARNYYRLYKMCIVKDNGQFKIVSPVPGLHLNKLLIPYRFADPES